MEAIAQAKERRNKQQDNRLRVHSISVGDIFPDHGEIPELRQKFGLDAHGIAQRVIDVKEVTDGTTGETD